MSECIVYSERTLAQALGMVRDAYHRERRVQVKIMESARSLRQNALSHAWYEQLALELPQDDAKGWKAHCKLHHGVPILRAEDAEFKAMYDAALKGLTYEQKLKVMGHLPVTSVMSTKQLNAYLESVQAEFVAQGVMLEFPEDARWAA